MEVCAPARIEEAGLNALQTRQQLFYDGWLLRLSPGKAKRARSVNAHFGSTLPLDAKIDHCEALYRSRGLPVLFRMTPFVSPPDLVVALEERGYVRFEPTLVQIARLDGPLATDAGVEATIEEIGTTDFAAVAGTLRGSSVEAQCAHAERLAESPLAIRALVVKIDGRSVSCGQSTREGELVGIYDMVTAADARGRGLATALVARLLTLAWREGASHAYLQVDESNERARSVYRRFGFTTAYGYDYRAPPGECR